MFNAERLLGQLLQTGLRGGLGRSRRRNRGSGFGGLSSGTKAQIGMGLLGVAIAAYEHYTKQKETTASTPTGGPAPQPLASDAPGVHAHSMGSGEPVASAIPSGDAVLLVQAMVAAAAADGVIDETERSQMTKRAQDAGFDDETRRFLDAELAHPKSLAVIVASASGRPAFATDLYAASCAAITPDTDAERVYLETLARRLGISEEARAEIHKQLEIA